MSGLVIGVTGLPCAGKSLAARLLADGEVTGEPGTLVKADDVGHEVLVRPAVLKRLCERFGDGIVNGDPAETRRRIAAVVFANPAELAWLEGVVHPLVTAELDRVMADAAGKRQVVVEAALLTAAGMDLKCDVIVTVEADFSIRMKRAAGRGWDRHELERRDSRLRELFEPARLGSDEDKLVYVRNDADDNRLAVRMREALRHHIKISESGKDKK